MVKRGKKRHLPRPEKDWIRSENPNLRIVNDVLWHKLLGRASWFDGHSDHLWTGFGTCDVCAGNIRIQTRRTGKVYECGTHRQRGHAICANDITVRQPVFDDALRLALREF